MKLMELKCIPEPSSSDGGRYLFGGGDLDSGSTKIITFGSRNDEAGLANVLDLRSRLLSGHGFNHPMSGTVGSF